MLLATKLGMTRIFLEDGTSIPVTAVQTTPNTVTGVKTTEKHGYTAVQVGAGVARHPKKPQAGQFKGLEAVPRRVREFRVDELPEDLTVGSSITCESLTVGDKLVVVGTSKGKGFAGVIKRHGFHRGPETHGSDHHRAPGSIGSMFPQHVIKGKKMPGRMGGERITLHKVKVVDVDVETGVVLVKGALPGAAGSLVTLARM